MDEHASFEPQAVLSRRRAGWNRLLLAVPVLAFAGIAWAGLSGPRSDTDVPADAAVATHEAIASSGVPPAAIAAPNPGIAIPLVPDQVLGIEVRSVRGLPGARLLDASVIAVAGWYEAGTNTNCPPAADIAEPAFVTELGVVADARTFCERTGRLFATSPSANTDGNATYRLENRFKNDDLPALTVRVRPGVIVPPVVDQTGQDASPVVLIGSLVTPDTRCLMYRGVACTTELEVDRVIWAAGLGRAQTTSILPRLLDTGPLLSWRPRDRAAQETFGPTGAILMETLVDRETLAAVDPGAAAAIAGSTAERIWYRRVLGLDPAGDSQRWIAIDDATGDVLASSPIVLSYGPPRLPADGTNALTGG